ncbi:thioredoxin family protein [Candidatus Uhrbacteria bacterium]|nr:thioredoxin family protein [Candidatus Uhrbacteria bacterium]
MKVLKCGAVWCSGCLVMKPRWKEIEGENPWLQTEYFDFDEDREKIAKYGIEGGNLPVFIFLDRDGEEFLRLQGEVDKERLVDLVRQNRER